MQKELNFNEDISVIAGLKKYDNVLVIGGNIVMPFIKKWVNSVTSAKKTGDINQLIQEGRQFDRVFIARENVLDEMLVLKAARLTCVGGLICFLSDDDDMRNAFLEAVERNFPLSSTWSLDSNIGKTIVTNARGNPSWME